MKVLLFLALLFPGQANSKTNTKVVKDGDALVSFDWCDGSRILSLRQTEDKWHEGTVWLLSTSDHRLDRIAWKGLYQVLRSSDDSEDVIYLRFAFTRKYERIITENGTSAWRLNAQFQPEGMMLEIPLEDSAIPESNLTASVLRAFFVDQDGKDVTKRYEPDGLLEKLSGQGAVRSLRKLESLTIGETLRLKRYQNGLEAFAFSTLLPPGFRIREPKQQVIANYRAPTDSSFEKLWAQVKQSKDPKEILETTNVLLKLDSGRAEIHEARARALIALKEFQRAIESYSKAIDLDPKNPYLLRGRAYCFSMDKQYGKVKADHIAALRIEPNNEISLNDLAWLMSTSADASVRDGANAVIYAQQVCKNTEFKNWVYVDTLAAAYAESGDFRRAVLWQTEALELLTEEQPREAMKKRLELYKQDKPYRKE